MNALKQHPLVSGTLVLTVTGFISRIIGFFYRIYLSRLFGEEGMGIYQLLSPVLALSFSLTAAAYQTAISKSVAEQSARTGRPSWQPLLAGLSIALPLSFLCTAIVFCFAQPIGSKFLMEERTVSMLRILSFSIPLSCVHSCVNGYFYGIKKAGIPAVSQLLEQLVRVGSVFCICAYAYENGRQVTINVAVAGLALGELAALLLVVPAAYLRYAKNFPPDTSKIPGLYWNLLTIALPLTANRVVLNLLQSVEAVSIPAKLKLYGYDTAASLSVYGVLTGMAMPLIFFPNALTSSISVLLLPLISESFALGDIPRLRQTILGTVKYCLLFGLPCMFLFVFFGHWMGTVLFDSALAGHFITTLGFICPFLYLDTALSGILHGLALTPQLFAANVLSLLLRLFFVFCLIPRLGITGYLWGILVSQLVLSALYLEILGRFLRKKALFKGR